MIKIMTAEIAETRPSCANIPGSAILEPVPNMNTPPFAIPSFIFMLLAVPLVLRWIPQNRFYGVRTRKTLSDKQVWLAVNRLGGLLIIASSLIYLSIAALVPSSTDITSANWWGHLCGFVLPLVGSILIIHFYMKRL